MEAGFAVASIAALAFAATDFAAALVGRRTGSVVVVFADLAISAFVLGLLAFATTGSPIPTEPALLGPVGLLGFLFALAYLALFEGLRLGPVSVVSPVTSTFGATTVVLAILLLGERPTPIQLVGVVLATVGAVFASLVPEGTSGWPRLVSAGPVLGLVAVVLNSLVTVGLQGPIRELGWLAPLLITRISGLATAFVVLLVASRFGHGMKPRRPGDSGAGARVAGESRIVVLVRRIARSRRSWIVLLLIVGTCDSVGQTFLAVGLSIAPAWLVGLVASSGSILVAGAGLAFLGERLRPSQWIGIALLGVSLVSVNLR